MQTPADRSAAARRIFIVEDDKLMADLLEDQLREMGYCVIDKVFSAEDAVARLAARIPDLVLMDIRLRGKMDGIDAARFINGWYQIPIVFLTAYSDREIQQRVPTANPFGYLLKPFGNEELRIVIEVALQRGSVERELKRMNLELLMTRDHGKALDEMLSICAWCKKVKSKGGRWQSFEDYFADHFSMQFSHGICPECLRKENRKK